MIDQLSDDFVAAYANWLGVTEGEAYQLLSEEPLQDVTDELTAAGWDESEHPRHPAGSESGGEFAPAVLPPMGLQKDGTYKLSKAAHLRLRMESWGDIYPQMPDILDAWPNLNEAQAAELRRVLEHEYNNGMLTRRRASGAVRQEARWVMRDVGTTLGEHGHAVVETPPSEALTRLEQELADHIVIENYSPIVQRHLDDLALLPEGLLGKLGDRGTKVYLGTATATGVDRQRDLKGVRPRGWSSGTWDEVAGLYDPGKDYVILGQGNHGSNSLALHETAHAIDEHFNISSSPEFRALYRDVRPELGTYQRQRGEAGPQEAWAEAVAHGLRKRSVGTVRSSTPFLNRDAALSPAALRFEEWVLAKLEELAAAPD